MMPEVPDGGETQPASGIDISEFEALRGYLFAVAYRMLGSASEAEDIVQEAYLRAHLARSEVVRSPRAYLTTIVTRLCLNHLTSARVAREAYPGPWLPEPAPTEDIDPPEFAAVERAEAISLAFLVLLERLSPEERAVYVLREAFDYPYDEIAVILEKSIAATRQLAHRARERVATPRPRFSASPNQRRQLGERFLAASRHGDLRALTDALTADVTAWIDGGPKKEKANRLPIVGRDAVARWLIAVMAGAFPGTRASFADVNGADALLLWQNDDLVAMAAIDLTGDAIQALRFVVNPDKLIYLRRRLGAPPTEML